MRFSSRSVQSNKSPMSRPQFTRERLLESLDCLSAIFGWYKVSLANKEITGNGSLATREQPSLSLWFFWAVIQHCACKRAEERAAAGHYKWQTWDWPTSAFILQYFFLPLQLLYLSGTFQLTLEFWFFQSSYVKCFWWQRSIWNVSTFRCSPKILMGYHQFFQRIMERIGNCAPFKK